MVGMMVMASHSNCKKLGNSYEKVHKNRTTKEKGAQTLNSYCIQISKRTEKVKKEQMIKIKVMMIVVLMNQKLYMSERARL